MAQRQFKSDDTSKWRYGFGNGSDGVLTISTDTNDTPVDASCSGTASALTLSATNASFATGQLILIYQVRGTGAGNWELNRINSYSAGTITLTYPLINTYTDSGASQAYVQVMKQYSSVTIAGSQTYAAKAWDGDVGGVIGWFCNGTTTVTGTVTAAGQGYLGANSTTDHGYSGEGTSGARNTRTTSYGNAGGGCDPSYNAAGDGGGNGTAGTEGAEAGGVVEDGVAGSIAGNAALTSAVFGGGGSTSQAVEQQTSAIGGDGGGFILIISKAITITGSITAIGAAGGASTGGDRSRGGGGGAGGSILLKAQTATLGANLVLATGGAGGIATGGVNANYNGGAGGSGRIHLDYKTSTSGTTNPTLDATQDVSLYQKGGFTAFL